jgi:hypothetical protein
LRGQRFGDFLGTDLAQQRDDEHRAQHEQQRAGQTIKLETSECREHDDE